MERIKIYIYIELLNSKIADKWLMDKVLQKALQTGLNTVLYR